jgi:serine/threonine protein kinase/tetratricopeptide (TPR) repeat protein
MCNTGCGRRKGRKAQKSIDIDDILLYFPQTEPNLPASEVDIALAKGISAVIDKTISHYKILEKTGEGGMGVVYKARDLKLDRIVALKFLPPRVTTLEEEKQRFIREARAASSLDHNNICAIHEIDETTDGQLFITMAFYEGKTLDARIKDEKFKINDAAEHAIQIAEGLRKAHEKSIIHRDIKPSNIMLTSDGIVKILDFGLAKLPAQNNLTRDGTTLGTLAYMSPEQARGDQVDNRTDIWSLGVILYEMLTGELPFKGDYDQAVVYSIVNDEFRPASGLRPEIPAKLDRIITKCLQKNPADRYQQVDELITDLRNLDRTAKSDQISREGAQGKKRYNSKMVLSSAGIVLALAIAVYYLISGRSENPESGTNTTVWKNSIAVLPFVDLSPLKDQEYFCDGMTDKILTNLTKFKVLKVISRTSVMKYKNTNMSIQKIGGELQVKNILEGSILKSGNRIRVTAQLINAETGAHLWADDYERQLDDIFDIQDEVSEKIADKLLVNLSPQDIRTKKSPRPKNTEAYDYFLKGKYLNRKFWSDSRKNLPDFQSSIEMFQKALDFDSSYSLAYAGLADLYDTYINFYPETKEKFLPLQEKYVTEAYALDSASAYVNFCMSLLYAQKNDRENNYRYLKKTVSINNNSPDVHHSLALFLRERGLYDRAVKHMNRAIELDPLVAYYYAARGNCLRSMGEFEPALNGFRKALEFDPDHWDILSGYASCQIDAMKYAEAEASMKKYSELYPDGTNVDYYNAIRYALAGERDKALQTGSGDTLNVYLILNMKQQAINKLIGQFTIEKQNEQSSYLMLKNQHRFDSLRSDPRFQILLEQHRILYEQNLKKYGNIDI